jgi:hypothetical protein
MVEKMNRLWRAQRLVVPAEALLLARDLAAVNTASSRMGRSSIEYL